MCRFSKPDTANAPKSKSMEAVARKIGMSGVHRDSIPDYIAAARCPSLCARGHQMLRAATRLMANINAAARELAAPPTAVMYLEMNAAVDHLGNCRNALRGPALQRCHGGAERDKILPFATVLQKGTCTFRQHLKASAGQQLAHLSLLQLHLPQKPQFTNEPTRAAAARVLHGAES